MVAVALLSCGGNDEIEKADSRFSGGDGSVSGTC